MTDLSKFSLIFPDEESQSKHLSGASKPNITTFVLEELGLCEIFRLKNSRLEAEKFQT